MSKKEFIEKTIETLQKLPAEKVAEVSEFADSILKQNEDKQIVEGIAKLSAQSKSYDFLNEEENLYTLNDVKEPYNAKR
jgi:hypothetical protein